MSPCATFFPGLCLCLWVVVGGDLALLAQPKLVAVSCFSPGERSSSGLLEWDSKSDALETLGFLNHYQMKNPSECLCVLQNTPGGLSGCVPEPSCPQDRTLETAFVADTGRWDLVTRRAV